MPSLDHVDDPAPPRWESVDEPRLVYRFLRQPDRDADDFVKNFESDEERKKTPAPGEHRDLATGMSAFTSEAAARKRWAEIKAGALKRRSDKSARSQKGRPRPFRMSIGDYIGEVLLVPGEDFELVDEQELDGHLTIRGDMGRLAARVVDVYPAETSPT